MADRTLALATRNKGKIHELRELLSGFDISIKGLDDLPLIPAVKEDGKSFEENAYKKASFTAKFLDLPAMADDSGLVVRALDGAPGVLSARYAGDNATDRENNLKLLREMKDTTDRSAYFECSIVIALPGGSSLTYTGRCEGEITFEAIGGNGFGYDPVFLYPPSKKTFAQMSAEEKNNVSHRGKAVSKFKEELNKVLIWLDTMGVVKPYLT